MEYDRIQYYMKNPGKIIVPLASRGFFNWMPDEAYLKFVYRGQLDKKLNLKNPRTFNEKLQWLKLYDRNPKYQDMVDKVQSKTYVSRMIGEQYIIPTLGVWDSVEQLLFTELPDQFVIKCTHDSGSTIICKDKTKFDISAAKKKISNHLKKNLYWFGREWPYKNVTPRIIVEPYLDDGTGQLKDYKFFCFNGKVRCFKIDFDRNVYHRANYYDPKGNQLPFGEITFPPDYSNRIKLPLNLNRMIELAEVLSKDIPFVRVDFYEVQGHIKFGELTFFPSSGFRKFTDEKWDVQLGDWLNLPKRVN